MLSGCGSKVNVLLGFLCGFGGEGKVKLGLSGGRRVGGENREIFHIF